MEVNLSFKGLVEIEFKSQILRTSFSTVDGCPFQVIHPPQVVVLAVEDLRTIPENQREAEAEQLIAREFRYVFNIEEIPLVRWTLLRLAENEYLLVQVEHHFIHDGWSLAVLLREVKILYEAFAAQQPSPLPELPIQYVDFAVWQRRLLQGESLEVFLAYWRKRLAGSPPLLELPTDRPRP